MTSVPLPYRDTPQASASIPAGIGAVATLTCFQVVSGVFGGLFLSLSYFGTDQSQVQRYIGGASVREGRLGLMVNAVVKIPMQFGILLLGALLFTGVESRQQLSRCYALPLSDVDAEEITLESRAHVHRLDRLEVAGNRRSFFDRLLFDGGDVAR